MSQDFGQSGNAPYSVGGQYGTPLPPAKSSSSAVVIIVILAGVLVFTLLICGVLVALLLPAVSAARQAAQRMQDANSLKQVALAMHNYESSFAALPAPAITDAEGNEALSWRVALLPFIDQTYIYERINLENVSAWDSEANRFLLESTPPAFVTVRSEELLPGQANVFLIATPDAGPDSLQAAFTIGQQGKLHEIQDGLSNTIMAVMLVNRSVEWTRPMTLTPDEAYAAIQGEPSPVTVAMMDGSVKNIETSIDKETFLALCTRNGNESVSLP